MKKLFVVVTMLSSLNSIAYAATPTRLCESDGNGAPAKVEFQVGGPGYYHALALEYQNRSVLADPTSVFNHMGLIIFHGENGIAFNIREGTDEFVVTVPGFGDQPLVTARGTCRLKPVVIANCQAYEGRHGRTSSFTVTTDDMPSKRLVTEDFIFTVHNANQAGVTFSTALSIVRLSDSLSVTTNIESKRPHLIVREAGASRPEAMLQCTFVR